MTEDQRIINEIKYLGLPVFIWGNGELAELTQTLLKDNGVHVEGRVVDIPLENRVENICSKEELNQKMDSYILIKAFLQAMVLSNEEVKDIFGEKCIQSYALSELYSSCGIEKIDARYAREHRMDFQEVYEVLEDAQSKECLKAFLNAKIEEKSAYLYPYITIPQYFFESNMWRIGSDEILFDAGAYDGDSIRDFLNATDRRYKRIIAFEPDKGNMKKLQEFIKTENLKNINTVCIGLADGQKLLKYNSTGTMMSVIAEEGKEEIQVDSIDNILEDAPVTIIKMDIEGYEKEALLGAKQTIQKYKPMLFISAYHKKDDLFTIQRMIKSFSQEYRFFFRIHKPLAIDAVLYAVPEYRLKSEE